MTVELNEEELSRANELAQSQMELAKAENSVAGVLCGGVQSCYSRYVECARAASVTVLEGEEFWNKFRRRFPGTYWGYANYGTEAEYCIGRAVFVVLGPKDKILAGFIDDFGWFEGEGYDAVHHAFIERQDEISGAPIPGLWFE